MTINRFISPMLDHNMYFLLENTHCIVIDPYYDDSVSALLSGLTVDFLLVSHEHYDHISGVNQFKERYGCRLIANEACNKNMQNPAKNFAKFYEAYCQVQKGLDLSRIIFNAEYSCRAEETFSGELSLLWQGHRLYLREAPGHSKGGNLILADDSILFSGDTLLPEETQVLRFPGGSPKAFQMETLPYIQSLDKDLTVYPGHGERFLLKEHHLLREAGFSAP